MLGGGIMPLTQLMEALNIGYAGPRVVSRSKMLVRDYASAAPMPYDKLAGMIPSSFRAHRGKDTTLWEDGKNCIIEHSSITGMVLITICDSSVFSPYKTWRIRKLQQEVVNGERQAHKVHKKRRDIRRA